MDIRWRSACLAGLVTVAACGVAHAGDVPPPSPYALPPPVDGPDDDDDGEAIRPWRHWGDHNNQGGFVKDLLAPGQVQAVSPEEARRIRFCRRHPDQCDD